MYGKNMNENEIVQKIANQVVSDTQFWIAIIGILGGIVGAIFTLIGNFALHWFKEKPKRDLDSKRKELLVEMLDDERFQPKWRNLFTLSSVAPVTRRNEGSNLDMGHRVQSSYLK